MSHKNPKKSILGKWTVLIQLLYEVLSTDNINSSQTPMNNVGLHRNYVYFLSILNITGPLLLNYLASRLKKRTKGIVNK